MKLYIPIKRFQYTIHNIVGHPVYEILSLLGREDLGRKIHDLTLPPE
jgi:hypothetical protein